MKFVLLLLFFPLAFVCSAQLNTVTGTVIDAELRIPMAYCNVFISNSSTGVITDVHGYFKLNDVSAKNTGQVIISASGYETYSFTFSPKDLPLTVSVKLNRKIIGLGNVIIQPADPQGWDKWSDQFKKCFLGESENAASCEIMNPEVLKFRYSKKKDRLEVSADTMLVIRNRRLGYLIKYQLETFSFDMTHEIVKYLGYPLFEELEHDTIMRLKYAKRRLKAYKGSLTHFMRCVYNNSLAAEGYKLKRVDPEPGFSTLENDGRTIKIDLADENGNVQPAKKNRRKTKQQFTTDGKLLKADDILLTGDDNIKNVLSFDNFLNVEFNEPEAPEYNMFPEYRQISRLSIINKDKKLVIQPNGKYYPGLDLLADGYMGWEKIGDLLPVDYQPPPKPGRKKNRS